jgi:predicted metal-dependent hydrolase
MMRTYKDIQYSLVRSRRKTASIYIERDGQVSILVPDKLTDRQVEALLESKRKWIYKGLAEWQDLNARRVHRDYVNGEGFLYLGRSYRLKLVSDLSEPLMLKDGYFCLRTNNGSLPDADAAFKAFYRAKGAVRIPPRVAYYQAKMDVEPKAVKLLDLKHRWASCSPGGNLNFHWKCMMAPLTILDYIVVHELAHLIYPNHTKAFWNEVDKVMPDFQERKEWLRVNGAGMDL